jgi:hypothetical protein
MNSSRVISPSSPYCSIRRPTNPTGEPFAATMRSFSSRTEKRGGSVDMSNPVLCDSQTPTASIGTSAINRSRSALASSSVSPTMTLVARRCRPAPGLARVRGARRPCHAAAAPSGACPCRRRTRDRQTPPRPKRHAESRRPGSGRGCPCGDSTTLSGPLTLKNRPTWLIGRTLAGSATRPFSLSQTKASA